MNINFDSVITGEIEKGVERKRAKEKKKREKRKVYPRKITFSSRNCG